MDLLQRMLNAIKERLPLGHLLSGLSYAVITNIETILSNLGGDFLDLFTSNIPRYFLNFTSAVHFFFNNFCFNKHIPQVCNKHEIISFVSDMPYIIIYNNDLYTHPGGECRCI